MLYVSVFIPPIFTLFEYLSLLNLCNEYDELIKQYDFSVFVTIKDLDPVTLERLGSRQINFDRENYNYLRPALEILKNSIEDYEPPIFEEKEMSYDKDSLTIKEHTKNLLLSKLDKRSQN